MRKEFTVIITRASSQAAGFAAALNEIGFSVLELPVIEISSASFDEECASVLKRIENGEFSWLVFTSKNGVDSLRSLSECMSSEGRLRTDFLPESLKIAVQGKQTAHAVTAAFNRTADLIPETFVAEDLAEALALQGLEGSKVLIAAAKETRGVLAPALAEAGAEVEEFCVYETKGLSISEAKLAELYKLDPRQTIVTFFSPSAAEHLVVAMGDKGAAFLRAAKRVSIGPITSAALAKFGMPCDLEASDHSEEGVMALLKRAYS